MHSDDRFAKFNARQSFLLYVVIHIVLVGTDQSTDLAYTLTRVATDGFVRQVPHMINTFHPCYHKSIVKAVQAQTMH